MRVNELFYSLQGEGYFTGIPAFFIRFAGCNLACSFCDTDHAPFTEMSEEEIADAAARCEATHVVITGGEPALQLTRRLLDLLHDAGKFVQMETNGSVPFLPGVAEAIDWVTCSPKEGRLPVTGRVDELKVLYDGTADPAIFDSVEPRVRSLQPLDTGDPVQNRRITAETVAYILAHPQWCLSLQTHKIIGVR